MKRPFSVEPDHGIWGGLLRDRVLPRSEEAEVDVVGSMLMHPEWVDEVAGIVDADDFVTPVNVRIFAAVLDVAARGDVPSPAALAHRFENDPDLTALNGSGYLRAIASGSGTLPRETVMTSARTVHDLSLRRKLFGAAIEIAEGVLRAGDDVQGAVQIETAETRLAGLNGSSEQRRGPRKLTVVIDEMHDHIGRLIDGDLKAIETGIHALDEQLGGLMPGDVCVIAGRPGMGKSLASRTFAANVARRGDPVLLLSQEMSAIQVGMGFAQQGTSVDMSKMRRGNISRDQVSELMTYAHTIRGLPIWVDDTSALTVEAMRRKCREVRREAGKLPLVIVDYLQLMAGPEQLELNITQKIEYISRKIKVMAGEEGFAAMLLSQLSRAVENRESKRPSLSDLRNSGAIEQDADSVALLYREEYYLQQQMPTGDAARVSGAFEAWEQKLDAARGVAEAIVAKNRYGTTGVVKLHFNGARGLFEDAGPRMNGHAHRAPWQDVDDDF